MTRFPLGSFAPIAVVLLAGGCFPTVAEEAPSKDRTASSRPRVAPDAREQSEPRAAEPEANAFQAEAPQATALRDEKEPASRDENEPQTRADDAATGPDYDADTPVLPEGASPEDVAEPDREPVRRMPPPEGARRLDPQYDVWIDPEHKAVVMDGFVSLREGPLEMFSCTRGTKEHESIVSVNTKAFLVHAALLNVGAEPGTPVRFLPEFQPPTGTEIAIEVVWTDEDGQRHTAHAQDWVRDARTGKAMEHPWVFAGSGFWKDDQTGISHYQAEGGDFICVSNFASAMLDVPVESTQANEGLAYEAFTERIPPLGTHVRLILTPKLPENDRPAADDPDTPREEPARDLDD